MSETWRKCGHPRTPENSTRTRYPACRRCSIDRAHRWRLANPERAKELAKRTVLYKKHPELKPTTIWKRCGHPRTPENTMNARCRACWYAYKKTLRRADPEKHRELSRIYRQKNLDKERRRGRIVKTQARQDPVRRQALAAISKTWYDKRKSDPEFRAGNVKKTQTFRFKKIVGPEMLAAFKQWEAKQDAMAKKMGAAAVRLVMGE